MKRVVSCMLFMLVAFSAMAEDIPVLQLDSGVNEIKLTVSNNYFSDLQDMKVSVDSAQLPGWLDVAENVQVVDIQKGQVSSGQLVLSFSVDNAPVNAVANLPLVLSDNSGNSWSFNIAVKADSEKPVQTELFNNFPNPFNPTTTISYSLQKNSHAKLAIYNSLGQLVRTLVDGPGTVGNHIVQWDGRNDAGQSVSSGVYLYTLISGNVKQTKRMTMVE